MENIYIRAFKAIDDYESSMKFVEGHKAVLENVGVKEVTSSNNEWVYDPNVVVILIESGDRKKIFGGSRVHIANDEKPLPLVDATIDIDPKVVDVVEKQKPKGTGEICGLWNSLEVAGYGVGSVYAIRSAISILPALNLSTCFALCSPFTASLVNRNYGTIVETSIGNNGTFYYPKIDLLATIVFLQDAIGLNGVRESEKEIINSLRKTPNQEVEEQGIKGKVHVTYNLAL